MPRDVRELAARGTLVTEPHDQLTLMVLLQDDADPDIARLAAGTLETVPLEPLRQLLARASTSEHLRSFFRTKGIEPAAEPMPDEGDSLVPVDASNQEKTAETHNTPLNLLPVIDRLKLAMKGTRDQRGSLIRDSNKMVAAAVLSSPKLTESEVEGFARMGNVSDEVLRIIGTTRAWTKKYTVISALTRNPKTPHGVALTLISRLNERDVKSLSADRNVPEPIRMAARKLLLAGEARRH